MGYRSLDPTRARIYGGSDYAQHANDHIITMAMVETKTALDNVEEIVSVPNLDAIYIGPGDLSLILGGTLRVDSGEPIFMEALAACRKYNIVPGIHTADPEYSRQMAEVGFQFITILADTTLLNSIVKRVIAAFQGGGMDELRSAY